MAFKDTFKEAEERDEFWTELAILEFTSQISKMMQEKHISKVQLANLLGTSPAYVTKIFRGDANFTMRSMVKLARILGGRFTPGVIDTAPPVSSASNLIPFPQVVYKTGSDQKMIANYGR